MGYLKFLKELDGFTVKMQEKTAEISKLIGKKPQTNNWLFGSDVKRLLNISESTLRRMRLRKELPFTKIGRTYYYPSIFFEQVLLQRIKNKFKEMFDEEE